MSLFMFDASGMEASLQHGVERSVAESTGLCLLFMTLTIVSALSNGAVIISAILERWKEVDNFTFVFCVSLSFNHFFLAFHIHSMIAYSVVANTWELHVVPCLGMGVLSLYLNSVYLLQILLIVFDSAVARYSNVRVAISVSLSKKIALHTWIIAVLPQVSPIILKTKDPYLFSAEWGGCFQNFLYRDVSTLFECLGIYLILPLGILIIWYVVLLFKEEGNRRLAITVSRMKAEEGGPQLPWRNHRTTVGLSVMYLMTILPYTVCCLVAMSSEGKLGSVNKHIIQFANVFFCLGSILIPIVYLVFCPTFCKFIIPEKRYPIIYKMLKWTHPPILSKSDPNIASINNRELNKIEEEDELEEESDEEYIELPAINVQLAYQHMSSTKADDSPPSLRY